MRDEPKTILEAVRYFKNDAVCIRYLTEKRWSDGKVICPTCGGNRVHYLREHKRWQCTNRHSKRQFSIKVGTIMEDSPISLDKWLGLLCRTTRKVASCAAKSRSMNRLSVAKPATCTNRPRRRKLRGAGGGSVGKIGVQGLLERGGNIRVHVINDSRIETLVPNVDENVEKGAHVYSDELKSSFVLCSD